MNDYSVLSQGTRDTVTRAYQLSKQLRLKAIPPLAEMIAIAEGWRETVSHTVRRMGVDMSTFCTALASAMPIQGTNTGPSIPISEDLDGFLESALRLAQGRGEELVEPQHVFEALSIYPGDVHDILMSLGCTGQRILAGFCQNGPEGEGGDDEKRSPNGLNRYARDLTRAAEEGKLHPVIGRDEEISRIVQALLRKNKNNPLLVGPAGTGKTAIAEGLAQRIAHGDVPEGLRGCRVFSLDITALIAGAGVQGEFENRLKQVMKDVMAHPEIILFVDEIHLLIGTGAGRGAMDAANILKPALSRGEIRMMGATTTDEYRKYIETDKAFERRFQTIAVNEPDTESAIDILRGIKAQYEDFHGISIPDATIRAAVLLSQRYLNERCLPDKAIDLLDEAASRLRMERGMQLVAESVPVLEEDDIHKVVTAWTGIPLSSLQEDEMQQLQQLEETLSRKVIGQAAAVHAVSTVIRRNKMGLGDPGRPIGSFLFLGPTGVGKTALAKTLSEYLFNSPDAMVRLDMSEYQQEHTVARLFGAPPGYVGYGQGGQLTEAVRRHPYSVILLDEMEKAHPKVFDTLLQVLDDGRMTDGEGRTVNFRNTIIIMTSNLKENQLGSRLSPEFLNRIDDIVCFSDLGRTEVLCICKIQMEAQRRKMADCGINLHYDDQAVNFICDNGYSPEYGARPVKRAVNHYVVDGIASGLINGEISKDAPIVITAGNEGLRIHNA